MFKEPRCRLLFFGLCCTIQRIKCNRIRRTPFQSRELKNSFFFTRARLLVHTFKMYFRSLSPSLCLSPSLARGPAGRHGSPSWNKSRLRCLAWGLGFRVHMVVTMAVVRLREQRHSCCDVAGPVVGEFFFKVIN